MWVFGVLLVIAAVAAVMALTMDEERRRWRWARLSLEARLREAQTRGEVFERALARLREDEKAGKLSINEDYRSLFERLTAEARGPSNEAAGKED